jgi:hypothetical protein
MNLNLGPFDRCADVLPNGAYPEYGVFDNHKYFGITNSDGTIRKLDTQFGTVMCPLITVAYVCEEKGDTPENRQLFIDTISIKVIRLILDLHNNFEKLIDFNKLFIPIRQDITIHLDPKHNELYGYVELGMMIFI